MPVIKSAIKAMKQANAAKLRNQATKAEFRGAVKAVRKEIAAEGKKLDELTSRAIQAIDKAAKKGVIHKKAADRRKSRLMLAANKASKNPVELKSIKEKTEKPAKTTKPTTKKTTAKKSTTKSTKKETK